VGRYFIIFILFCIVNAVWGQPPSKSHFAAGNGKSLVFTVPANNHFLDVHTECIGFALRGDTIMSVQVFPKTNDTAYLKRTFLDGTFAQKLFFFDFDFEADRLVFAKKYPKMPLPVAPSVEVQNINGQKDRDKLYKIFKIILYADSTTYGYAWNYELKRDAYSSGYGVHAKFTGNIQEVAAGIAREVATTSIKAPFDSVLVFQSVVEKHKVGPWGQFRMEHLIHGAPSAFSEIAEKYLVNNGSKWKAAINATSGGTMSTRVKIYVRLNRDGSVTIELPRYLGSFTGD
jgi:hypothetical protein